LAVVGERCNGQGSFRVYFQMEPAALGFHLRFFAAFCAHSLCSHTGRPIRIFADVHAAGKNDHIFFAPNGANSAKLSRPKGRFSFLAIQLGEIVAIHGGLEGIHGKITLFRQRIRIGKRYDIQVKHRLICFIHSDSPAVGL